MDQTPLIYIKTKERNETLEPAQCTCSTKRYQNTNEADILSWLQTPSMVSWSRPRAFALMLLLQYTSRRARLRFLHSICISIYYKRARLDVY